MSLCHDLAPALLAHGSPTGWLNGSGAQLLSSCIEADAALRSARKQVTATIIGAAAALIGGLFVYRAATEATRENAQRSRRTQINYASVLGDILNDKLQLLRSLELILEVSQQELPPANAIGAAVSRLRSPSIYEDTLLEIYTLFEPEVLVALLRARNSVGLIASDLELAIVAPQNLLNNGAGYAALARLAGNDVAEALKTLPQSKSLKK